MTLKAAFSPNGKENLEKLIFWVYFQKKNHQNKTTTIKKKTYKTTNYFCW